MESIMLDNQPRHSIQRVEGQLVVIPLFNFVKKTVLKSKLAF
jgi:hypothetical protein